MVILRRAKDELANPGNYRHLLEKSRVITAAQGKDMIELLSYSHSLSMPILLLALVLGAPGDPGGLVPVPLAPRGACADLPRARRGPPVRPAAPRCAPLRSPAA